MMEIKFWDKTELRYEESLDDLWIDMYGDVWRGSGNEAYGYDLKEASNEYEPHIYLNGKRIA